jgi:hypothetical protein
VLWNKNFVGLILGKDYPMPIVNLKESARAARAKVWGHRKHPLVQKENKRILNSTCQTALTSTYKKSPPFYRKASHWFCHKPRVII